MDSRITPCIWFDTQAEEAATFYVSVFKNSRIIEVSRYQENMHKPAGTALVVNFELNGNPFMALNGGPEFTPSEAISFVVSCDDQDEVDEFWTRLTSDGGQESQCGWLKDRFGVSWQITPKRLVELLADPDPARAQRAMQAMLGMRKIVVAELEAAANG